MVTSSDRHEPLTFSIEKSRSLGGGILIAHLFKVFGQRTGTAEKLKAGNVNDCFQRQETELATPQSESGCF